MLKFLIAASAIVVVCQGQWGAQPMGMMAAMNYFLLPDGSRLNFMGKNLETICNEAYIITRGTDGMSDVMRTATQFLENSVPLPMRGMPQGIKTIAGNNTQWQCLYNFGAGRRDAANTLGDYFDTVVELHLPIHPCQNPFCGEGNMTPFQIMQRMAMTMGMGGMGGMGGTGGMGATGSMGGIGGSAGALPGGAQSMSNMMSMFTGGKAGPLTPAAKPSALAMNSGFPSMSSLMSAFSGTGGGVPSASANAAAGVGAASVNPMNLLNALNMLTQAKPMGTAPANTSTANAPSGQPSASAPAFPFPMLSGGMPGMTGGMPGMTGGAFNPLAALMAQASAGVPNGAANGFGGGASNPMSQMMQMMQLGSTMAFMQDPPDYIVAPGMGGAGMGGAGMGRPGMGGMGGMGMGMPGMMG